MGCFVCKVPAVLCFVLTSIGSFAFCSLNNQRRSTQSKLTRYATQGSGEVEEVCIEMKEALNGKIGVAIQSGRRTVSRLAHKDAALMGWRVGDVIVEVNGKPVKDNEAVKAAVTEALQRHSAGEAMRFVVRRLKAPVDRSCGMMRMTPGTGGELTMSMLDLTQSLLGSVQVVLFLDGTIKAPNTELSAGAVKALLKTGLAFKAIDCNDEKYNPGVKAAIQELTGQQVPQLFAGGQRVANGQEIQEMDQASLLDKLSALGAVEAA
ncbi:unnamed protein product [Durusdinium trenchii]|uniref:PDZ domain-containing protein n=1 Tax=Durusdinium trenchii TaxID=1381693 RepID=A0ABP0KNV1_9DINO